MKEKKPRAGIGRFGGFILPAPRDGLTIGDIYREYETFTYTRGVVALFDVLGASRFSSFEALDFIEYRDEIVEEPKRVAEEVSHRLADQIWRMSNEITDVYESMFNSTGMHRTDWLFVGDTVCLVVDCDSSYAAIPATAFVALPIIPLALEQGIPFRGALAFGAFVRDDTTLLGEAVSAAGAEYENSHWLGITVPSVNDQDVQRACAGANNPWSGIPGCPSEKLLIRYPTPTKRGVRDLWTVAWPAYYLMTGKVKKLEELSNFVESRLSAVRRPAEDEPKYANTSAYVQFCQHHWELVGPPEPNPIFYTPPEDEDH